MLDDLRITRPFGIIGGTLFALVAISCFLTVKNWVETPVDRALAYQYEKQMDQNIFDRFGGKEKFDELGRKQYVEQNRQITIGAIGAVFWGFGLFACFVRSLWSPRCILLVTPFKIWANVHLKDQPVVWFDVAIFIMAFIIWKQWEKEQA